MFKRKSIRSSVKTSQVTITDFGFQSLDPVTYSFLLSEQAVAKGEVWLGLTGKDWPTPKKKIMAWHISVEAKDESILTNNQSYLWVAQGVDKTSPQAWDSLEGHGFY